MSANNGGPAFPEVVTHLDYNYEADHRFGNTFSFGGMTLRDYFAAEELSKKDGVHVCDIPAAYAHLADHCYRMADAMLAARDAS